MLLGATKGWGHAGVMFCEVIEQLSQRDPDKEIWSNNVGYKVSTQI